MTAPAEKHEADGEVKPFLEHLIDLRNTLIRCSIAIVVAMLVAAPAAPAVMRLLLRPLVAAGQNPDTFLLAFKVTTGFSLWMRIAFWTGLVIASPFVVFFVGDFVFPGLKPGERRIVVRLSFFVAALFAAGVALGYCILPPSFKVMIAVNDKLGIPTGPWLVTDYVVFCMGLMAGFGLVFELPVLIVLLGRFGLITSTQLREKRPYVIVILLTVAAVMTPPDVFTQALMAGPLIVLYEAAILMVRIGERKAT